VSSHSRSQFLSFAWLQTQLDATDVHTLIAECQSILENGDDEPIRLLQSALKLSEKVLAQDKSALAYQLVGRLMYHDSLDDIKRLLDSIIPPKNSFYPILNGYDPLNPVGKQTQPIPVKEDGWVSGVLKIQSTPLWERTVAPVITRTGHEARVVGLAHLPNGDILSWGMDKTLCQWNLDGDLLITMYGHEKWVDGALILRDNHILSWGGDATLRVWDLDGNPITVMTGHEADVNGAIELSDGHILSWSADKTLRLWDKNGATLAVMTGHEADVYGAMILRDGDMLSWGKDATLRRWSPDGTFITALKGHEASVLNAIELAGGHILSVSADSTLRMWDKQGNLSATLAGHTSWLAGMCELADGRILSWSYDNTLRLWGKLGEAIATLDESYDGNLARIIAWGKENGFDADKIYPTKTYPTLANTYKIRTLWDKLQVYHPQRGEIIHTFFSDARIHSLLVLNDLVVVGDRMGRVLFLQWVG